MMIGIGWETKATHVHITSCSMVRVRIVSGVGMGLS